MDLELYVIFVALAAVLYAGITRYAQTKLVNRKEMEAVQKESKELNAEYKEASKRNDKTTMERIMKKQMEMLPKMNKVMFSQFKPMVLIIVLFLAFTTTINFFNPMPQDDISIVMNDNGENCDAVAGDKRFSACYDITGDSYGKWTYSAKTYANGQETGLNHTYFFYGTEDTDTYVENGWGVEISLSTDKQLYKPGDTVHLYADVPENTGGVEAVLDHGTWFHVDLPFTLPIFNVKRIYQPYWWFILISLVLGLIISFILKKVVK